MASRWCSPASVIGVGPATSNTSGANARLRRGVDWWTVTRCPSASVVAGEQSPILRWTTAGAHLRVCGVFGVDWWTGLAARDGWPARICTVPIGDELVVAVSNLVGGLHVFDGRHLAHICAFAAFLVSSCGYDGPRFAGPLFALLSIGVGRCCEQSPSFDGRHLGHLCAFAAFLVVDWWKRGPRFAGPLLTLPFFGVVRCCES